MKNQEIQQETYQDPVQKLADTFNVIYQGLDPKVGLLAENIPQRAEIALSLTKLYFEYLYG